MKIKNGMKIQQKPPRRFSQAKYHRWEFLTFKKKMITKDIEKPRFQMTGYKNFLIKKN